MAGLIFVPAEKAQDVRWGEVSPQRRKFGASPLDLLDLTSPGFVVSRQQADINSSCHVTQTVKNTLYVLCHNLLYFK